MVILFNLKVMTKTPLLGSHFAATVLKYYAHKYIYIKAEMNWSAAHQWGLWYWQKDPLQHPLYDILQRLQRKAFTQKMKNNPSTIKNTKCVQSYEVPKWEGQTKLLTDLTIKVKHGGYLHSDQAKGSRREKSEIHQCWAGRNKNVIFIVKIILKKKPTKQAIEND